MQEVLVEHNDVVMQAAQALLLQRRLPSMISEFNLN